MNHISIFCGAHEGKNPKYAEAARSVSECIAKKGINVVFGGGNVGLMKIISDTALDNGVDYSEAKYNEVCEQVDGLLKMAGFNPADVPKIPCSSFHYSNLQDKYLFEFHFLQLL